MQYNDADDFIDIQGKTYFKYYKRVVTRRKAGRDTKSPWCRSSRRRYRRVLYYVDAKGYEFPASDVRGDSEDGEDMEVAQDEQHNDNVKALTGHVSSEGKDEETIQVNGKKYKKQYKRIRVKRKPCTVATRSPWCKPSKKAYRWVLFYVDEQGNEVLASELMQEKENDEKEKAPSGKGKSSKVATDACKTELNIEVKPRRTRSNSPRSSRASMSPVSRGTRSQSVETPSKRVRRAASPEKKLKSHKNSTRASPSPRLRKRSPCQRSAEKERGCSPNKTSSAKVMTYILVAVTFADLV